MSATETQQCDKSDELVLLEPVWLEIRAFLEKEKKRIADEIMNYPPPIPACDIQFNFLLEERSKITQALRRMREASAKSINGNDLGRSIHEFIGSCKYIDQGLEAKLLSDLRKVLDRCNH